MATRRLVFLIKVLISTSLIIIILYKYVNVSNLTQVFKNTNFFIFPFLIFLVFLTRLLIAYQTKISLIPFNVKTCTSDILKVHFISTFYSLALSSDLIAGGITWYLLSKENGRRAEVASVIVYLRILNLLTLLPFALVGIYLESKLEIYHIQWYVLWLGFLLLLMLLPFFWYRLTLVVENTSNYIILLIPVKKISKRLLEANYNVWNAVKINQAMPLKFSLKIIALSFASQLVAIVFMYLTLEMVNIHLPISVAAWLLALVAIIAMLPLTIGGIGVRDFSFVFILKELYNVPSEASLLASTVILFIGTLFFGVLLGGYYAVTLSKQKC